MLRNGERRPMPSDAEATLASHRIVFAAERARRERRVVSPREI